MTVAERRALQRAAWGCFAGVAVLTVLGAVARDALTRLDHRLGELPQRIAADQPWVRRAALEVETVTRPDHLLVLALLVAMALYLDARPRAAEFTILVPALARYGYPVLKEAVRRPRPVWADPVHAVGGWSFPSGHCTVAAAGAGTAIVLTLTLLAAGRVRRLLIGAEIAVAVVVALDRLLLGVHHPSDVLAGLLLGTGLTLATLLVLDPRLDREHPGDGSRLPEAGEGDDRLPA